MCFNKVEGPKTLRRHTLVKNSITQITEDFIKKIFLQKPDTNQYLKKNLTTAFKRAIIYVLKR